MAQQERTGTLDCPECGGPVACGAQRGQDRCWCMDHPPLALDPALPDGACLCERCLRRRLARQTREAEAKG